MSAASEVKARSAREAEPRMTTAVATGASVPRELSPGRRALRRLACRRGARSNACPCSRAVQSACNRSDNGRAARSNHRPANAAVDGAIARRNWSAGLGDFAFYSSPFRRCAGRPSTSAGDRPGAFRSRRFDRRYNDSRASSFVRRATAGQRITFALCSPIIVGDA